MLCCVPDVGKGWWGVFFLCFLCHCSVAEILFGRGQDTKGRLHAWSLCLEVQSLLRVACWTVLWSCSRICSQRWAVILSPPVIPWKLSTCLYNLEDKVPLLYPNYFQLHSLIFWACRKGREHACAIADRGQMMTCRSLVSLSAVGSRDWTQVIRLNCKLLYSLSHLASPYDPTLT